MRAEIYEIESCPQGRLAVMPRPRGGNWLKTELWSLHSLGVSDLVSLLTPPEEKELDLTLEGDLCREIGLRFRRYPVSDRKIPTQPNFAQLIDALVPVLLQGGFVAVHCRAGIGRSSVVAAALLSRLGVRASDALAMISAARGFDVPDTDEQHDFILSFDQSPPA